MRKSHGSIVQTKNILMYGWFLFVIVCRIWIEEEREREREKEGRIRGLLGFSWEGNKLFIFCLNGDVLLFG